MNVHMTTSKRKKLQAQAMARLRIKKWFREGKRPETYKPLAEAMDLAYGTHLVNRHHNKEQ